MKTESLCSGVHRGGKGPGSTPCWPSVLCVLGPLRFMEQAMLCPTLLPLCHLATGTPWNAAGALDFSKSLIKLAPSCCFSLQEALPQNQGARERAGTPGHSSHSASAPRSLSTACRHQDLQCPSQPSRASMLPPSTVKPSHVSSPPQSPNSALFLSCAAYHGFSITRDFWYSSSSLFLKDKLSLNWDYTIYYLVFIFDVLCLIQCSANRRCWLKIYEGKEENSEKARLCLWHIHPGGFDSEWPKAFVEEHEQIMKLTSIRDPFLFCAVFTELM